MMEAKPIWASRTFWVNMVALVASVAGVFGTDVGLAAEQQTAVVGGIIAVANIVLRVVTKGPVRMK